MLKTSLLAGVILGAFAAAAASEKVPAPEEPSKEAGLFEESATSTRAGELTLRLQPETLFNEESVDAVDLDGVSYLLGGNEVTGLDMLRKKTIPRPCWCCRFCCCRM